jgi:excisionase family DNA binding protein
MTFVPEPERPQQSRPPRRLLPIQQVAEVLGVSRASVRRLLAAGQLPVVQFNRRLLVDAKDLDAFIERAKNRQQW